MSVTGITQSYQGNNGCDMSVTGITQSYQGFLHCSARKS